MGKFQKRTNMKKSIIALFAAATMVAGVNAQDEAGGTGLGVTTGGLVGTGIIGAAIVGARHVPADMCSTRWRMQPAHSGSTRMRHVLPRETRQNVFAR